MSSILSINAGQHSLAGNKAVNEDACGYHVPDEPQLTTKGLVVVIADGVSSSEAGREAAHACVRSFIGDYFSTPDSWTVKTSGQRVLGALNRWLYGGGQTVFSNAQGMLSTLSAMVIKSTTAHIFHVGDTRIYRLSEGDLEQLTQDHQTWVGKEKAFLSRAMGAAPAVEIDYRKIPAKEGDIYFFSTDGVHEFVSRKAIISELENNRGNPERAAKRLVAMALENGSEDNVSCQVVEVESLPSQNEDEFYSQLTELPFPPPLESGMILDGYKIVREIHATSRSQLYLAQDIKNETQVVLKTPSENYNDDAQYIDGFLHEEWVGQRITNTHVLKILEPVQQRRFLYYVMEYIEGQNLREWMNDNTKPSLVEVRQIVTQLASGLRAFHRQEMLHQDLKPENIMFDEHGTVKIVDFGSTKIAGIQEIDAPLERGTLLGTYDYCAPEYLLDQAGSNRSDIYSLGAITYEMLTAGKLPYGAPLSKRTLNRAHYIPARQFNPELPQWLDAALEKAVRKKPENRYALLSEFVHDIQTPNNNFVKTKFQPIMARDPIKFWKTIALSSIAVNIIWFIIEHI
ncbi:MAG: bifunctional protein-serine/threonine kinase/phosphatase [Gammaproteobacteria bacterium]|nr:bifunctional protein-serine/threonine kinase/phosphatase [Gammaproteobacteria bacterium]